jgi:hypothetical protein
MKFSCPISGKILTYVAFSNLLPTARIHPVIDSLTSNNYILRNSKFAKQEFINQITDDELLLATGALLHLNPLIHIHAPINPIYPILRENFSRLYYATGFCLSPRNRIGLPGYSITPDTANLLSLLSGWIEEIEDEKKSIRKRYREEILSRLEERHNKKLRNRIFGGKVLFHQLIDYKTLEWLFDCMGIPNADWDCYRTILYNDVWENLRFDKFSTRILELEAYLESWYSLNSHKPILAKHIHHQLSEFMDLGGSLPKDYYVQDEEGNIESLKYGNQDSFKRVIKPKLIFKPIHEQVIKPSASNRPKKEEFIDLKAYAKAILEWNRKNILN